MTHIVLLVLFSLIMLPGLAGIVLPIPGLAYMFVIALIFSFIDRFQHISVANLIILGIILIVSILADTFSGLLGAKYGGASKRSIMMGTIGLVIGSFLLPPFGGLAGLFLGVLLTEIIYKTNKQKAMRAASGSLLGSLAGMFMSLILSILFIVLFIVFAAK